MKTASELKAESDAIRKSFHREWAATLQSKAETFYRMPASALAYEIAWHAFKAGIEAGKNLPK